MAQRSALAKGSKAQKQENEYDGSGRIINMRNLDICNSQPEPESWKDQLLGLTFKHQTPVMWYEQLVAAGRPQTVPMSSVTGCASV